MSLTKVTNTMIADAPANIKDFGAVGDGVTNDTASIQLAINSGAKEVFIPDGVFVVTALTVTAPTRIFGVGTLKKTTVTSFAIITITSSNVSIEGIRILGAGAGATIATTNDSDNAIQVDGGSTLTQLQNFNFTNLKIDGVAGMGMRINYATKVLAQNNIIENCGYAGILFDSVADSSITDNKINNIDSAVSSTSDYYGISLSRRPQLSLSAAARTANVTVEGNRVSNIPKWIGLDCHAAFKCIFTNNSVYECRYGVNLQYDDAGAAFEQSCEDIIVANNIIFGLADKTQSRFGISSLGDSVNNVYNRNILIADNIVSKYGYYDQAIGAIDVVATESCVIENNIIHESVRVGISMGEETSDSVVRNNIINGVQAGDSSAAYIFVNYSNLSNNLFEGNRMYNDTGNANFNPSQGIFYSTGGDGVVYSKNRMRNLGSSSQILKVGGSANIFTELRWILESESIQFSATATGGAPTESLGNQIALFRRLPTTSGTFIYRIYTQFDSNLTNPNIAIRGNNGGIYTPLIYTVNGANIAASAVISNVVYCIEGVYFTD